MAGLSLARERIGYLAWIMSPQELRADPRTRKLARLLDEPSFAIVGRIHFLWWWSLDYAEDGDLSKLETIDIAEAMEWSGDPVAIVAHLIDAGFLDGSLKLQDWQGVASRLIEQRHANAEKQKAWRERNRYVTVTSPLRNPESNQGSRLRNGAIEEKRIEEKRIEHESREETIAATIPLHSTKPVSSNGEERASVANAPSAPAKPPPKPLESYEVAFLEVFEFRSGRYPTKAMRSLVQGMVEKYGDGEFLAAAKIAAERNVRKLPYVEGILKKGGANAKNSIGSGRGRGPDVLAKPGKYDHFSQ